MTERGEWPVALRGVTETVVATLGPNERWNLAALGLHAPDAGDGSESEGVTATTWGRTRTRRNFERQGGGVVQFTSDPRDFVDAALSIREEAAPVLDSADAWVEVRVARVETGVDGETAWARFRLTPVESAVRRRRVPTINRGFGAVVEATVAASRLEVDAYETATLVARLAHLETVVERCGGPREREAFARIDDATGWHELRNESF